MFVSHADIFRDCGIVVSVVRVRMYHEFVAFFIVVGIGWKTKRPISFGGLPVMLNESISKVVNLFIGDLIPFMNL